MASGMPCVVTDVGDAALEAGSDREAWAARRHAARQRIVDRFSLSRMAERYRDTWMALLPAGQR